MRFSEIFQSGDWRSWPIVRKALALMDSDQPLELLARQAQKLTRQHFGRTMRLFAPLYLSNECINNCAYCGFSRDNPIWRTTLTLDEVQAEARHLVREGFRNLLLVAGEHPKFVSNGYIARCVEQTRRLVPAVSIEVGPMEQPEYESIVRAGAEGLVVYQETYDPDTYRAVHTAGPKKDFAWRLDCPSRGGAAGFRRLGIGALLGLAPWQVELPALVAHADYLLKTAWRSTLTISLPRLRPAAGGFTPKHPVDDPTLVRMICTLRLCFPQAGLVLSTREPATLRDGLALLGITMMSAGSHTEPGGYTGSGCFNLHQTVRGRRLDAPAPTDTRATGQFEISDERPAHQVAQRLRQLGLDPVWKDWDSCLAA